MNQLRRPKYIGEEQLERTIRIRLSDTCNFNCSYCIEHDTLPKEYNHMKQYDMILLLENLELEILMKNIKRCWILPTLHF